MDKKQTYQKVASYEAKKGKVKKVLLLYSGGLDTSTMLKWIQDEYKTKVVTLTLDIGQQKDDLEAVRRKALKFGAMKAIVDDAKEEFADKYLALGIKANAHYQDEYHLSTPIGRAILATKAVEYALKEGCDAVAHGSTGKGNDQVRIDGYVLTLAPTMKVIAPVREWNMDRDDEIAYAEKHGIPVPASADFPYSDDDNMWGMTWEGGEIENPSLIPPRRNFLTTYTLAEDAPDKEELVDLEFKNGLPVKLNGKSHTLAKLISELNIIGGRHGVGVVHLTEDRLVGVKSRGVYEQPAAHVIIAAHRALERYVSTRQLNETKEILDTHWGYLCYAAQWFDPTMAAINAFNEKVNERVDGKVRLRLYKGSTTVISMTTPYALDYASFTNKEGYTFNTNASAGFIEVYTLQMKIANEIARKNKKR